jgi:hypothetical protein
LDHSSTRIERESHGLDVPPRNIPVLGWSKNLRTNRRRRSWRPDPVQTVLATGFVAFLGLTLGILIHSIHPAIDKLTFQKDVAELARLETQSRMDDSYTESRSLASTTVVNARIDRADAQPQDRPHQSEAFKSRWIASKASLADQRRDTDLGAARKQLRAFKKDLEIRPDNVRNPQKQRPVPPPRQRYEQKGLSSFLTAIGHALGFSRN